MDFFNNFQYFSVFPFSTPENALRSPLFADKSGFPALSAEPFGDIPHPPEIDRFLPDGLGEEPRAALDGRDGILPEGEDRDVALSEEQPIQFFPVREERRGDLPSLFETILRIVEKGDIAEPAARVEEDATDLSAAIGDARQQTIRRTGGVFVIDEEIVPHIARKGQMV